ncbi:hypothetical protein SORBI_3001G437600 [Sorghum bicolor]|uniref:Uncharacterized protein n=1 Tax=Sorghum bicolor TaxID=4558 RepID=A0A1B6QPD3_SORBI|nr:hypothetical protein SORBI_3001G437600 [Sorghum bicolor]
MDDEWSGRRTAKFGSWSWFPKLKVDLDDSRRSRGGGGADTAVAGSELGDPGWARRRALDGLTSRLVFFLKKNN